MLCCRIKTFLNTWWQLGKSSLPGQDWGLLMDELCTTIAQKRVKVLKQTLACTSHVYQTVWPKARRHIVEHRVRRRWGVRIEVGSWQNRAELCAIFFSSSCCVTSSTVFALPSNSPTALCIFCMGAWITVLRRWMTSVLIFRFSVLDKYLCDGQVLLNCFATMLLKRGFTWCPNLCLRVSEVRLNAGNKCTVSPIWNRLHVLWRTLWDFFFWHFSC